MTKDETIKVLAIMKAAYPNSYKGMTRDEANGTVMVWATQFAETPVDVVMIAINKLISTNTFPPSIHEVKAKIKGLYWEAWCRLRENDVVPTLSPETVARLQKIVEYTAPMQSHERCEASLPDLLETYARKLLNE